MGQAVSQVQCGSPCVGRSLTDFLQAWEDKRAYLGGLHAAAAASRADALEALLVVLRGGVQHVPNKAAQRIQRKVVNQRDPHGQTPLMLACAASAADCVRLLLAAGADPTLLAEPATQSTCLHIAARQGSAEVIDALLGDESRITVATASGRREALLRQAMFPSPHGRHKFADGRPSQALAPLHVAASCGHVAAVEALIKWGATLSVPCDVLSEEEQAAWAPATGPRGVRPRRLAVGAEAEVPLSTPLHLAAAKGHWHIAQALLRAWAQQPGASRGADLRRLLDSRGHRPADVAHAKGHTQLARMLRPTTPLQQVIGSPGPPFPSLAVLAAEALRQQLVAQLDSVGGSPAAQHAQRDVPAAAAAGSSSEPAAGSCQGPPTCPICLDVEGGAEGCMMRAAGCGHAVCLACARQLCSAPGSSVPPVRCPLCRSVVGGWVTGA